MYYLRIALQPRTTIEQCSELWKPHKLVFSKDHLKDKNACEKKLKSENTDFVLAHKNLLMLWVTFITPGVICVAMQWIYEGRAISDEVWSVIHKNEWIVSIQIVCCVYITFVPFYSDKHPWWHKIAPVIHFIAVHLIFLVLPIVSALVTAARAEHVL